MWIFPLVEINHQGLDSDVWSQERFDIGWQLDKWGGERQTKRDKENFVEPFIRIAAGRFKKNVWFIWKETNKMNLQSDYLNIYAIMRVFI